MGSLQSNIANVVARTIRNSFFIHKAELKTQRNSFERFSVFAKYPRFVKSEKISLNGINGILFIPKKINTDRVVLYLHGGAYAVGSAKTHKALIARIARSSKCKAIGIDYRLAPDHPYPAALVDAYLAYQGLIDQGHKNIFLVGDSAGGGLCLALMLKLRNQNKMMPKGAALMSPWTDLTLSGESLSTKAYLDPLINPTALKYFADQYIGNDSATNPYISPLYAQLHEMPPILIQVGSNEVILDDSTRLAKKLKKAGGEVELEVWKNMFHVWQYLGGIIPEAMDAINSIGSFIREKHAEEVHQTSIDMIPKQMQASA